MKTLFLLGFVIVSLLCFTSNTLAADGWASVSDTNGTPYNVTGGADGATVTVTTTAAFKSYATSTSPYVIQVSGTIDLSAESNYRVNVKSNKTIIGIGTSPTIYGSLNISNVSNVIISHLNINFDADQGSDNPSTDGITIQNGSHNIWVDHCSIYNSPDGLLDIGGASDFVTVSWCKFYYETGIYNTLHHFTNLIGSADEDTGDIGKLHITFHHNWWASLCRERMPRVRYGQVHIYNNYYGDLAIGSGYCIGVGCGSRIRVESNYFDDVPNPWKNYYSDYPLFPAGEIGWNTGNVFYSCSVPTWAINNYATIFTPPYSYTLDTGSNVKTIVMGGAGMVNDTTPPEPNQMTFATVPYAASATSVTMVATTASDLSSVEYYFACTAGGGHDSGWQLSPSYTDTGLTPSTSYTYKVKAHDLSINHNETGWSDTASATTLRFDCSPSLVSDLDEDCQVTLADYVILANEWLRPRLETELIVNGTFDSELAPWQDVNAIGAIGIMTATFDGSIGLPPGSAALDANASTTAVNHHRFYQAFPVTIGSKYMLSGKWSGSLADPAYSSWNDWIEVYIGFNSTATPSSWGSKMYRKLFRGVGNSGNINFAPDSNGTWEWEDITDSQNTNPAPPEDNIFTASQNYMVVAFNLGGQSGTGLVYLNLDNIKVVECLVSPADLNKDCELNLLDLAQFALDWLGCNRIPSGECRQ
jgi:pectate lyase